ncbi:MAG: chemotaxis protein CheB [Gemmatimonadota bacterium]
MSPGKKVIASPRAATSARLGRKRAGRGRNAAAPGDGRNLFPVVGVGASAGGLEAFTRLLKHLPPDTGMAFVFVQHLDPSHASELTQLLARATAMPVAEAADGMPLAPDHVLVIPPNAILQIADGALKVGPRPAGRRPNRSVDIFFESLAQELQERVIGVVLSGSATDGTAGLEAIKAAHGITFAQDATAGYDSMPRSAVGAGVVDFVMSPENIASELTRLAKHPYLARPSEPVDGPVPARQPNPGKDEREVAIAHQHDASPLPSGGDGSRYADGKRARSEAGQSPVRKADEGFRKVLLQLRNHSGVDFSLYKSNTIQRRIARRMALSRYTSLDSYARFLKTNAQERDTLFSDVLISVTSFFRNPEAFDALQRHVFPRLGHKKRDGPIRVWVLGCSTGQEAYSIAMAFEEYSSTIAETHRLQIFATDLNEALLDKARAGLYARSLADEIQPERLRRFFIEEDAGYRVIKSMRESVVFARQNLLTDPPFSRLDLVCCRNLLIYLGAEVQKKALASFHYALKPGGFLFLGASESVGPFTNLFEQVDKKFKIFSRKPGTADRRPLSPIPARLPTGPRLPAIATRGGSDLLTDLSGQREADRLMVSEFAPPGVIVDADLQVQQFRGDTSAFLDVPRGKPSFDLLKMVRSPLLPPLRAAVTKAKKEKRPARRDHVRMGSAGSDGKVNLQVIPLMNAREPLFLVLFERQAVTDTSTASRGRDGNAGAGARHAEKGVQGTARSVVAGLRKRLADTERELVESRDYLASVQDQHSAASEELQAATEESQSANEELQSINEELETSKEELESANEELTTVNEEMLSRNEDLDRLNADLRNVLAGISTAVLVLGRDLTIRRFTSQAERVFNLLASDVGRSFVGHRHNLVRPVVGGGSTRPLDVDSLIREVMESAITQEVEVQTAGGMWFTMRVRSFLTLDNRIDGVILVMTDIDASKRREREAVAAHRYVEAVLRTARDPMIVLTSDMRLQSANQAFYSLFGLSQSESEGKSIFTLNDGAWDNPPLRALLEGVLPHHDVFNDFEVTQVFQHLGLRTLLLNGRRIDSDDASSQLVLLAMEDVTDRKRAESAASEASQRLGFIADSMPQKIFTATPDGRVDYFNQQWTEYTGLSFETIRDRGWTQFIHPDDVDRHVRLWKKALESGEPFRVEHRVRRADDQYRWHLSEAVSRRDGDSGIVMWAGSTTDIHEVKESERRMDEFLGMLAHELRNPLAPIHNAVQVLRLIGGEDGRFAQPLEMMDRHVRQVVRLIDDLLDVSRISRGKISLQRKRTELSSVVHYAIETVRPLYDAMAHELAVTMPPDPLYLNADPTRLAQIIGNLLNNAAKFTESGGRVEVSVEQQGEEALIRVSDTGIGLAHGHERRIFEMFSQVDTSLQRSAGGLGIGLALVRTLVELHDGTVEAHSEGIGHGSEFLVRLPLFTEPEPEPVATPAATRVARARCRILVVDDNRDSADSLSMMLELRGYETRIAYDGLSAVDAAADFGPDVVLLDIGLPKLNGFEVARRIRKQEREGPLLLVALTGWGQESDRQRSHDAGFDAHMVKPVDMDQLTAILERFLEKSLTPQ